MYDKSDVQVRFQTVPDSRLRLNAQSPKLIHVRLTRDSHARSLLGRASVSEKLQSSAANASGNVAAPTDNSDVETKKVRVFLTRADKHCALFMRTTQAKNIQRQSEL